MGRIVGIDLGTTNTAVAVISDGRPRVIEDDRGYKVLPSVVSARGEGRFVVGQAAHNLILTHPDRTVYATKRLIGRRWDSPEVQRAKERLHFQMREAPDGGVQVRVGEEWMTPAEVAAVVLQVARTVTERALGEAVDEAVITVPAHFTHHQRQQTLEAARLAGLKCDRLLNEPTAAALAYGHRKNIERTVAIFDLGGGTFDVTVLKLSSGVYEVLATNGDTYLGGEDFDYRIVDHLSDALQARSGADVRNDRNALQRLKDAAERAKCDLSFSDRTNVVIPHIIQGHSLETVLTRSTLESLTGDLVQRCIDITRQAVVDSDLQLSDIDEVILVGGQTRMPRVREAVSGLFGREPSRSVHPEEAVAVGAAVHAAMLADPGVPQTVLLDVTPFDLGIDALGGMFSVIIPRNSRVPAAEARTFATVHEGQTSVRVTVRQGESRTASDNEFLGELVLDGLKPGPRMANKLDVNFRLDSNGILHVTAADRATKEKRNISVRNYAERAREPKMPSPDQAAADREARLARNEVSATPVPVSAGTTAKAGLLASLFGIGKKKPKAPPKEVAPPPPIAAIDMQAVATDALVEEVDPDDLDREAVESLGESDAAMAAYVEEEEMYARDDNAGSGFGGSATMGLGGARLSGGAHVGNAPSASHGFGREPEGLDASSLFSDLAPDEVSDDPSTETRGVLEDDPFGGDPFGQRAAPSSSDPFASPFGSQVRAESDPFANEDGDEAVLSDEPGRGEGTRQAPTLVPMPVPVVARPKADRDPHISAPMIAEPAANPSISAPMMVPDFEMPAVAAPKLATPATPTVAAPMIAPAASQTLYLGGEADPFGTGSDGGATGMPADMFAEVDLGDLGGLEGPGASVQPDPLDIALPPMLVPSEPAQPEPAPVEQALPPMLVADESAPAAKKKKPARLRLNYRERDSFVSEYRENLRRNSSFIRTDKPLSIGRECVFEIDAPGLVEPLQFEGVVSSVSQGIDGEAPGMVVEYRLDERARLQFELAIDGI